MFRKKETPTPDEIRMKAQLAVKRLAQQETKQRRKADNARSEAKDALRRGDDRTYRTAGRRFTLATRQVEMVGNFREMAEGMVDVMDAQSSLTEIVAVGQDLKVLQKTMGLDDAKLEQGLIHIQAGMDKVNRLSDTIATTMEASILDGAPTENMDELRTELLAEIETEAPTQAETAQRIQAAADEA